MIFQNNIGFRDSRGKKVYELPASNTLVVADTLTFDFEVLSVPIPATAIVETQDFYEFLHSPEVLIPSKVVALENNIGFNIFTNDAVVNFGGGGVIIEALRPIGDVSNGGWTVAPLWSKVSDQSDATFIRSDNSNGVTCTMTLQNPTQTTTGGVNDGELHFRARKLTGSQAPTLTVELIDANTSTILATFNQVISATVLTEYTINAPAVLDPSMNLHVRLTRSGGGNPQQRAAVEMSEIWLNVEVGAPAARVVPVGTLRFRERLRTARAVIPVSANALVYDETSYFEDVPAVTVLTEIGATISEEVLPFVVDIFSVAVTTIANITVPVTTEAYVESLLPATAGIPETVQITETLAFTETLLTAEVSIPMTIIVEIENYVIDLTAVTVTGSVIIPVDSIGYTETLLVAEGVTLAPMATLNFAETLLSPTVNLVHYPRNFTLTAVSGTVMEANWDVVPEGGNYAVQAEVSGSWFDLTPIGNAEFDPVTTPPAQYNPPSDGATYNYRVYSYTEITYSDVISYQHVWTEIVPVTTELLTETLLSPTVIVPLSVAVVADTLAFTETLQTAAVVLAVIDPVIDLVSTELNQLWTNSDGTSVNMVNYVAIGTGFTYVASPTNSSQGVEQLHMVFETFDRFPDGQLTLVIKASHSGGSRQQDLIFYMLSGNLDFASQTVTLSGSLTEYRLPIPSANYNDTNLKLLLDAYTVGGGSGNTARVWEAYMEHVVLKTTEITVDTTIVGSSASDTVIIPFNTLNFSDAEIFWGDGSSTVVTDPSIAPQHTYATGGVYGISIKSGNGFSIQYNEHLDGRKLMSLTKWGNMILGMDAFRGCINLTLSTVSDLPNIESLQYVFSDCVSITTINGIENWDTTGVTSTSRTFLNVSLFNQDISGWDVSQVISFAAMFEGAAAFDQDISIWDITAITGEFGLFDFMLGKTPETLSAANLDALYISWAAQSPLPTGLQRVHFGTANHTSASQSARDYLVNTLSWQIIDGGVFAYEAETDAYETRVLNDGGEIIDKDYVNDAYLLLKSTGDISQGYSWLSAGMGIKKDASNKILKLYSLHSAAYDLTPVHSSAALTWVAAGADGLPEIVVDKTASALMQAASIQAWGLDNTLIIVHAINYSGTSPQFLYDGMSSTFRHVLTREDTTGWNIAAGDTFHPTSIVPTNGVMKILQVNFVEIGNGTFYIDNALAFTNSGNFGTDSFGYMSLFNKIGALSTDQANNGAGEFKDFVFLGLGKSGAATAYNEFLNGRYGVYV